MLKTLADHAEKMGIDLVLEAVTLMESNVVIFLDDLVELIEEVGSPPPQGHVGYGHADGALGDLCRLL